MKANQCFKLKVTALVAGIFAALFALFIAISPAAQAQDAGSITNKTTGKTYINLSDAITEASSGDTIELGEGSYTTYTTSPTIEGKVLTFVGAGIGKTTWNCGKHGNLQGEYNSDYSLQTADTITFKNMSIVVNEGISQDYVGFVRIDNIVTDNCAITGRICYWGYDTSTFKNTTFNAPGSDYCMWLYSSNAYTFDNCTFNSNGKTINVYRDPVAAENYSVNFSNCTVNDTKANKTVLNINDSTLGSSKVTINITDNNTMSSNTWIDPLTCSNIFGFGNKAATNSTGRTVVNINGETVFENGELISHSHSYGENNGKVDEDNGDWEQVSTGVWNRDYSKKCSICGWGDDGVEVAYTVSTNDNESDDTESVVLSAQELEGAVVVAPDAPTRSGYDFSTWNTAADGSGDSYAPGDEVTVDGPVTLYAMWSTSADLAPIAESAAGDSGSKAASAAASKTYSKASAKGSTLPTTGDSAPVALMAVIAAMGCIALACSKRARRD